MTVIAVVEAVALVILAFLFLHHLSQSERAWTLERRELLTRIQRPELIPTDQARELVIPDDEPDEIDLVGVAQEPTEAELIGAGPWD